MKKILTFLLILFMILVSCSTQEANNKEYLIENEDYIDLNSKYNGQSINYNDSLWYMNTLDDVPIPDPYVYVENDTYYIVGTSDRDTDVVDINAV